MMRLESENNRFQVFKTLFDKSSTVLRDYWNSVSSLYSNKTWPF